MNAALTLYDISNQLRSLADLEASDDLPEEVIRDTLEALDGTFEQKAVAVAKFVLALEANATAIDAAADMMLDRAKRIQRRADSIRAYLLFHLQATQKKRIESPDCVISRRANPPAVIVTDEGAVPAKFWVQPPAPPPRLDKKSIKAAIDAGERVEGAYVEAGERLDIKP